MRILLALLLLAAPAGAQTTLQPGANQVAWTPPTTGPTPTAYNLCIGQRRRDCQVWPLPDNRTHVWLHCTHLNSGWEGRLWIQATDPELEPGPWSRRSTLLACPKQERES